MRIRRDAAISPTARSERRRRVTLLVFGTPEAPTAAGARRALLLVALFVVGTAIQLLRLPRQHWNVPWAEDAIVFLGGALSGGPGVVFQPYSGYLHIVPRLLAEFAILFPLPIVPAVMTVLAATMVSLAACACFVFLETRLASVPLRFAAWIAVSALPVMGGEVLGSIANIHWFLLIAAFCATVTRSRSTAMAVAQALTLSAAVLSDPLAALLLPLVALRWWLLPRIRDRAIVITFIAATAVQAIGTVAGTLVAGERQVSQSTPTFLAFWEFYGYRTGATGILGVSGTHAADTIMGGALPWIALLVAAMIISAALVVDADRRVIIAAFAAGSVGFAAIVWSLQWQWLASEGPQQLDLGSRYAVVPTALLILALVFAADAFACRPRRRMLRLVIGLVGLLAVLIPAVVDLRVWEPRAGAPSWSEQLDAGARSCLSGEVVSVSPQIAPTFLNGPEMPCDLLLARLHR